MDILFVITKGRMSLCPCDNQNGETALMMAAVAGRFECVSVLLANGADVNFASLKVTNGL